MLMRWLAVFVFLADSGHLQTVWGTVFVAPPCRVNAHRDAELTLGCGDETTAGVVPYWHTPFGQVQRAHTLQDPVFMQHDGSLVVSNTSEIHSGLYYCLQQHTEGTAVWWYQLRIGSELHSAYRQEGHCGGLRVRRVRRGLRGQEPEQGEPSVSQELLVGAVVASVLLTFVVGFSAGALSRTHVLRCIRAVGRGRNPQHQRTDPLDPHPEVPLSTPRPESIGLPAKPRRSFKQDEEPRPTAYLEACDYSEEEENQRNLSSEEVKGAEDVMDAEDLWGAQEEKGAEKVRGTEEVIGAEDVRCVEDVSGAEEERAVEDASGAEVSEVSCAEEMSGVEEVKGADKVRGVEDVRSAEEVKGAEGEKIIEEERLTEEVIEVMSVEEVRGVEHLREEERDPEEENGTKEEMGADEERVTENVRSAEEVKGEEEVRGAEDEDHSDSSADTEGAPVKEQGGTEEGEEHAGTQPGEARRPRVRVIRLYQYNEDGERYCHLPGPSPQELGPLPSLKQRSLSLTRLRAIMATASAGPLENPEDHRETEQGEDKVQFYMESSS